MVDKNSPNHPFHMVNHSPWPFVISCGVFCAAFGLMMFIHYKHMILLSLGLFIIIISLVLWGSDMISEGAYQGYHSYKVQFSLKLGMILFIISEILFFFSFFWAFFHSSLSPNMEMGCVWPPKGIQTMNPYAIPLLNTVILLSSGMTITWSHHSIINNNSKYSIYSLFLTMFLGMTFSLIQMFEFMYCPFSMSDSMYGSSFFLITGFHGIHVAVGTILLIMSYISLMNFHLSPTRHFGFIAAAWYWHFVDVMWLFVYMTVYWWGS